MITFIVMPLTFGAWLVGGPIALALAGRAMKQLGEGEAHLGERRVAQTGVFLSRTMFWAGIVGLVAILLASAVG